MNLLLVDAIHIPPRTVKAWAGEQDISSNLSSDLMERIQTCADTIFQEMRATHTQLTPEEDVTYSINCSQNTITFIKSDGTRLQSTIKQNLIDAHLSALRKDIQNQLPKEITIASPQTESQKLKNRQYNVMPPMERKKREILDLLLGRKNHLKESDL